MNQSNRKLWDNFKLSEDMFNQGTPRKMNWGVATKNDGRNYGWKFSKFM